MVSDLYQIAPMRPARPHALEAVRESAAETRAFFFATFAAIGVGYVLWWLGVGDHKLSLSLEVAIWFAIFLVASRVQTDEVTRWTFRRAALAQPRPYDPKPILADAAADLRIKRRRLAWARLLARPPRVNRIVAALPRSGITGSAVVVFFVGLGYLNGAVGSAENRIVLALILLLLLVIPVGLLLAAIHVLRIRSRVRSAMTNGHCPQCGATFCEANGEIDWLCAECPTCGVECPLYPPLPAN